MASRVEEFPIFTTPDKATVQNMLAKMANYLHNISDIIRIDYRKIDTSMSVIYETVERIEKRRIYFHVFYEGCKMGELNEGALMCFWILKLIPFHLDGIPNNVLNAKIALCLFMNVLHYQAQKGKGKLDMTQSMVDDIYYAFRFRDLSKEAIMILAESLTN